jgi:hypothetical protein
MQTFGIPSISRLLVATGEMSEKATASKRAADTGVLMTEIVLNRPGSPRNLSAIARMNWLHDHYRRSGKIKDDDMLYTLSLFALEPIRWTRDLEWRQLTDLERCASGVYWKNLGEAMDIPYSRLRSAADGWTTGLEWLNELEAWSEQYEALHMVPSPANKTLALATMDMGLTNIPAFLKPLSVSLATALLSPRLRRAMVLEEPRQWVHLLLSLVISARKLILKHLLLPRPQFMRVSFFSEADPKTGKYFFEQYIGHPWYIKPTFRRRWNYKSWLLWITGGYVPSSAMPEYCPDGYSIPTVGPAVFAGKGGEEMENAKHEIRRAQGCPISMGQRRRKY